MVARLRTVFDALDHHDVASAAAVLNGLLAAHPASPHLACEDGRWRLHHHAAGAGVLPMWTSITAEAVARLIGAGEQARLGICTADTCDRVFVDASRNGTVAGSARRRVRTG